MYYLKQIMNIKEHIVSLSIADRVRIGFIILMQLALFGALVFALFEQAWLSLFIAITGLIIVWLPSFLTRNLHVHFPLEFELLLNIFIYSSIFLGEIHGYYTRFWWWDIVLHVGSGIALGFLGFLLLYSLQRSGKLTIAPSLLALFSFCFALSLGALWEIFEFIMDSNFGFTMQKTGITDTMWDLIVDAIGALVVSVSGYTYVKHQRHGMGIFQYYIDIYFSKVPPTQRQEQS